MTFERFVHEMKGPYIWGVLLLFALRGIYTCLKNRDWPHFFAFLALLLVSMLMLGAALEVLPPFFANLLSPE